MAQLVAYCSSVCLNSFISLLHLQYSDSPDTCWTDCPFVAIAHTIRLVPVTTYGRLEMYWRFQRRINDDGHNKHILSKWWLRTHMTVCLKSVDQCVQIMWATSGHHHTQMPLAAVMMRWDRRILPLRPSLLFICKCSSVVLLFTIIRHKGKQIH